MKEPYITNDEAGKLVEQLFHRSHYFARLMERIEARGFARQSSVYRSAKQAHDSILNLISAVRITARN